MKLSILIPVYNFDVRDFITELHRQSVENGIVFEILAFDDASLEEFKSANRKISSLNNLRYVELEKNLGRSKVRNLLANEAKHDYLLFFDCDSLISSGSFIKDYIANAFASGIVYGGRSYSQKPPPEYGKTLRWYYGMQREFIDAAERKKNPYRFFMTNNFLIPKDLFLKIKMNEKISGYGHEDTLFSQELKRKGIPIKHIENPLCHLGLESTDEFLAKTKQGIANLAFLIRNQMLSFDVKIFRYYSYFSRAGMNFLVRWFYSFLHKRIEASLKSSSPNLFYFDLLKLYWLICEMDQRKS